MSALPQPIIVVMGVSGSGKSSVAQALAQRIGAEFLDADDYHPSGNVEKMAAGVPLSDNDRAGWLSTLSRELRERADSPRATVLACSALREYYRNVLRVSPAVRFLYLKGGFDLIEARLSARPGHFMKADLLKSQFATLEEPLSGPGTDVCSADITQSVPAIVDRAVGYFQLRSVT